MASIVIANSASHYDDAARAMWRTRIEMVLTDGMKPIADGAMQRWFTARFRGDQAHGGAARVRALRATLEASDPSSYAAACQAIAGIDLRAGNARIACPALVIAGSHDEGTPLPMSEAIAAAIPGAQLREIDAAHLSAVENPTAFAALLTEFFAAQSEGAAGKARVPPIQ